jgi:hypothetical protein
MYDVRLTPTAEPCPTAPILEECSPPFRSEAGANRAPDTLSHSSPASARGTTATDFPRTLARARTNEPGIPQARPTRTSPCPPGGPGAPFLGPSHPSGVRRSPQTFAGGGRSIRDLRGLGPSARCHRRADAGLHCSLGLNPQVRLGFLFLVGVLGRHGNLSTA